MEVRGSHPAIQAGRDAERFAEGASEGFERTVLGIEGDVGDRGRGSRQLPRRAFEQESTAHFSRSFRDQRLKQPEETGATGVSKPRQAGSSKFAVERVAHDRG